MLEGLPGTIVAVAVCALALPDPASAQTLEGEIEPGVKYRITLTVRPQNGDGFSLLIAWPEGTNVSKLASFEDTYRRTLNYAGDFFALHRWCLGGYDMSKLKIEAYLATADGTCKHDI